MTELSVLERVRAAVAEAGYDPAAVVPSLHPRAYCNVDEGRVPRDVIWRAREVADIGGCCCRTCAEVAMQEDDPNAVDSCLADRRFVEDCGRDRSEP